VTSVSTTGVQSYGDTSVTLAARADHIASSGNQSITFGDGDRDDDERGVQTTTGLTTFNGNVSLGSCRRTRRHVGFRSG